MSHHHVHTEKESSLSTAEKLEKLLLHWIQHGEEHAKSYRQWADQARRSGLDSVAQILEQVAEKSLELNRLFEEALEALQQ